MSPTIQSIIASKRDGRSHSKDEIESLVRGAADTSIADYQLSAWLMAAYVHPLSEQETAWLTLAMADSGERLDLTGLPKPWVDKHSTGGVGDKTTIVLLPMLAACGLTVVKMSGRGLGITGGTVDKLSSIPGFRLDLSPQELKDQAKRIGLALTGQTPNLAPADKTLYALRDATATVDSIPLIVSSILSKKLAGGAETIVLDVKCGSGGFMRTPKEARELAAWLMRVGELCGLTVRIAITDMSQPLGRAVGNALEVREALDALDPTRQSDSASTSKIGELRFRELCTRLCALTLHACKRVASHEEGEAMARHALDSGAAWAKAGEWFEAQGATVPINDLASSLPAARVRREMAHGGHDGWIAGVDAKTIGETVVTLGGGRAEKDDSIDPAVGIEVHTEVGAKVKHGQPLFTIHAHDEASADRAVTALSGSVSISSAPVDRPLLVLNLV